MVKSDKIDVIVAGGTKYFILRAFTHPSVIRYDVVPEVNPYDLGPFNYANRSSAKRAIKTGVIHRYMASEGRGKNIPARYPNRKKDWKG